MCPKLDGGSHLILVFTLVVVMLEPFAAYFFMIHARTEEKPVSESSIIVFYEVNKIERQV